MASSLKIVHIVPGSGGTFYCQNCVRDMGLVKALDALGQDVTILPLYLPLLDADVTFQQESPVFYGAVNVFLEQKLPLYRHLPHWCKHLLDRPFVLKLAAQQAGATNAAGLEEMTLSVLRGAEGLQRRQLEQLVKWLAEESNPDVIHLSNALLLGLVPRLKRDLNAVVVCSLQDEDTWLEEMRQPYRRQCLGLMRDLASQVDMFIPVSNFYAQKMQGILGFSQERCCVVPLGVDPQQYVWPKALSAAPAIGFLSQIMPGTGLDILVDAFVRLKSEPHFHDLQLHVTGGRGPDSTFLPRIKQCLRNASLLQDVFFVDAFQQPGRTVFLQNLTLLSVPARQPQAFGLFQLEAMISGVPVVQPRHGAFTEIIEDTGGGVLYEPNTATALADTLAALLKQPEKLAGLAEAGRNRVLQVYQIEQMAARMLKIYHNLVNR